ncbi:MAG: hypothetical protein WA057_05310 [Candidatus Magasanikiibacteriota bacterium]
MTRIKNIQDGGRTFLRRLSAFFTISFGIFTIFFIATPKIMTVGSLDKKISDNFFIQDAYADVSGSGYTGDGCASDSTGGVGSAGACADGSAGACSCGDGVGSASSDATA